MARPREFEIDAAVTDAMAVFWANGYEASSLPLLLEGTGLSRGSLYKAFGGKQALFIAALRSYAKAEVAPVGALLSDAKSGDGISRMKMAFMRVPHAVRNGDVRGCLLCSAAAGQAAQDPKIAVAIHGLLGSVEQAFAGALRDAKVGDQGTAKMLLGQYVGLLILARAGISAADLEQSIEALMQLLETMPKALH